jgi:hypothetical protein
MNYLLGIILGAAGLAILIRNRSFSTAWLVFNADQAKSFGRFASFLGWDDPSRPFTRFLYRLLTIMLGLFLLAMALHSIFGTVYVGSAVVQPTDTIFNARD